MLKALARSRFRWIIPVAGFLIIAIAASQLSRLTNPASHAYAGECMKRTDMGRTFENTCSYDINIGFCLEDDMDGSYSTCPSRPLAPGARYTMATNETLEVDGFGKSRVWACRAPFVFRMKPSNSNSALRREACGRPLS